MQVTPLFHVTGDPDDQRCYNCGISLAKQRCAGMSRDNLDENSGGNQSLKRRPVAKS
jgi:hypothetical protein